MSPELRAVAVASALALATGKKVAGLYDHHAARHLRIAAEARDGFLQGYDGDRDARFGGALPEIQDMAAGARLHLVVSGTAAQGYDRSSAGHFAVEMAGQQAQLYDHSAGAWFAFAVQVA